MDKALVSFDGSLLLFIFLLHLLECFAGHSSKRGTFFFFCRRNYYYFLPRTQLFYFLFYFWMIFAPVSLPWYCKGRDRSSRGVLPPSAYHFFACPTQSCLNFPSVKSQFKVVCSSLVCQLILTRCPFWSFLTWD